MARSKTSSFWLTETLELPATLGSGLRVAATMDIGSLVDVGDRQGLSIEQCDIIHQVGTDFGGDVESMLLANGAITTQVSDLNPGGVLVRADDVNLIASGALNIETSIASNQGDFFPDTFGKYDESRTVVNDQLYVVSGPDATAIGGSSVFVTVRLKCRIITLTTKDWIALAITSVAND